MRRSSLLITLVFLLTGCGGGTHQIAKAANTLRDVATDVGQSATVIRETAAMSLTKFEAAGDPEGVEQQLEIMQEAGNIQQEAATVTKVVETITVTLPNIENSKTWFDTLMDNVHLFLIFGIIAGVVILAMYLGVGKLIRPIMTAVGIIPKAVTAKAKVLNKMLDEDHPLSPREVVAIERAQDPQLNKAFVKETKS